MADKIKINSEKKQKSQAATLKKVIRRLGRYRIFLVFSILLATVSVALTLYIPKLTGHAVDYVIRRSEFPGSNPGDDSDWCVHTDHGIGTVADECV